MCSWITLDKPSREHIFSHFLCHRKGISKGRLQLIQKIKEWLEYFDDSSVLFIFSVMSDSLQLHGLQHARLPCASPIPRACSNSCPLSRWCQPFILCHPLLFMPSIFPSICVFSNESVLLQSWLQSPSAVILEPKNISIILLSYPVVILSSAFHWLLLNYRRIVDVCIVYK